MKGWLTRLDQLAAAVNPGLVAAAIGLSTVDATVFLALHGPEALAILMNRSWNHEVQDNAMPAWATSTLNDWVMPLFGSR